MYLHNYVIFAPGCGYVKEGVSSHVDNVCPSSTVQENVQDVPMAVHCGIVQGSEAMLVPVCMCIHLLDISRQLACMKLGRREKYQPIQYCC